MKIFISHSTLDKKYVGSFIEHILVGIFQINRDLIFCSSFAELGITSGKNIPNEIRKNIKNTKFAFLFISQNYKKSEICLNELGACWVTLEEQYVIPLLLPDADFDNLGYLYKYSLSLKINNKEDVLKLCDDFKNLNNYNSKSTVIDFKINQFISEIQNFNTLNKDIEKEKKIDPYEDILYKFEDIIKKSLIGRSNGLYIISEYEEIKKLFYNLSQLNNFETYKMTYQSGAPSVKNIEILQNGNFLMNSYEIKI
jgi:hypothetical protein